MNPSIVRRELVAENLSIAPKILMRYEELGWIRSVHDREAGVVGYRTADIGRIWSIVSFQRDLGVNSAGIDVILRLRDQRDALQRRLIGFAGDLLDDLDDPATGIEADQDA